MQKIEIDKIPFEIDGVAVAALIVTEIGFKSMTEASSVADRLGMEDRARQKMIFRERIRRQVTAQTSDGKSIPLTHEIIGRIPVPYAVPMRTAMDVVLISAEDEAQEVLSSGDGLTSPVHIRLGRPIKTQKQDPISELEFMAQTLDQLEDAIVADNAYDQALALLAIAKPVGTSLTTLPSWAIDKITVSDGLFVVTKVLPNFFGKPESS